MLVGAGCWQAERAGEKERERAGRGVGRSRGRPGGSRTERGESQALAGGASRGSGLDSGSGPCGALVSRAEWIGRVGRAAVCGACARAGRLVSGAEWARSLPAARAGLRERAGALAGGPKEMGHWLTCGGARSERERSVHALAAVETACSVA